MAKVNISPSTGWTVSPKKTSAVGAAHHAEARGHMAKAGLSQPAQMQKNLKSEKKLKVYGAAGTTGK